MESPRKITMDLALALKTFKFFDKYRTMPKSSIILNQEEYEDAQRIIYSYLHSIQHDRLFKRCLECKEVKPLQQFGLTTKRALKPNCRHCDNLYVKAYAAANAEKILENKINRNVK